MKASGHEDISKVGIEVMMEAWTKLGKIDPKNKPRLGAFYLGNWMADFTQFYDPVILKDVPETASEWVKNTLDHLQSHIEAILNALPNFLHVEDKKKQVIDALRSQRSVYEKTLEMAILKVFKEPTLKTLIFDNVKFMGYFKHVHPVYQREVEKTGKMHYASYLDIYNKLFVRYLPHDHLDRPPVVDKSQKDKPVFATELDHGTRAKTSQERLNPDMYKYVRDHFQRAAADLADIDLNWASKAFSRGGPAIDDTDKSFNLQLAKLGHAMHLIEDFFAHSNFVEHAADALGPAYYEDIKNIAADKRDIFHRRLMAAEHPGWKEQGRVFHDPNLKTGFFDFSDSFISIAHLFEHWMSELELPGDSKLEKAIQTLGSAQKTQDEYMQSAAQIIEKTLEFIDDPQYAIESGKNEIADKIKEIPDIWEDKVNKYKNGYNIIKGEQFANIVAQEIFKNAPVPAGMVDHFAKIIAFVGFAAEGVQDAMTVYKAIKIIRDFVGGPLLWLKKFLKTVLPDFVLNKVWDILMEMVVAEGKEALYNWAGANRVGCHSLLAKDHGNEVLNNQAWSCAKALHWHTLTQMTRWQSLFDKPKLVCRSDATGGKEVSNKNCIDVHQCIDWMELIEFHLRHPSTGSTQKDVCRVMSIVHITKDGDSLASLGEQYRYTSALEGAFSWQDIAMANWHFKAPILINKHLQNTGAGYPVQRGLNYAFKPDVAVIIPHQRVLEKNARVPVPPTNAWWLPIMDSGKWDAYKNQEPYKIRRRNLFVFIDTETIDIHYHSPRFVKRADVQDFIETTKELKKKLDNDYSV